MAAPAYAEHARSDSRDSLDEALREDMPAPAPPALTSPTPAAHQSTVALDDHAHAPPPLAIPSTPATPSPAPLQASAPADGPATPTPTSPRRGEDPATAGRDADPMADLTASLAAMFPSLDRAIISDVLNSKGGNADAAVPDLLMLSGESVPDTPTRTAQRGPMARMESVDSVRLEQEQADAALARQLMAEEDAAARYQQRAHAQYNAQPSSDDRFAQLNYQPRQRPARSSGQAAPSSQQQQQHHNEGAYDQSQQPMGVGLSAGAREDLDQALVTVKNAANEAKRIGMGLFGQLKAKVGELQNPKPAEETQGYDTSAGPPVPARPQRQSSANTPAAATTTTPRFAPTLPHASRYRQSAPVASPPSQPTFQTPAPARDIASVKASANAAADQDTQRSSAATPPPVIPGVPSGGQPRQRISLLGPQGSSSSIKPATRRQDSDNDSLEFTRSPFEDDD